MNKEEILDKLRKMLFLTQQANECGLSNNDFKEDIETLSGAIGLIEKQEKIIDKMADYMKEKDIDEDICTKNVINPQLCNEEYSNCKECIKEYFKKEVEKENEQKNIK